MSYQVQSIYSWDSSNEMGFFLDNESKEISSPLGRIRLRPKHWRLFVHLFENANRVIRRDELIDDIWNGNIYTGPNGITHAIFNLRCVIEKLKLPVEIITFHKLGYRMQTLQDNLDLQDHQEPMYLAR